MTVGKSWAYAAHFTQFVIRGYAILLYNAHARIVLPWVKSCDKINDVSASGARRRIELELERLALALALALAIDRAAALNDELAS